MIKLLFVEGDPNNALHVRDLLATAASGQIEVAHVERLSTALRRLGHEDFDAILLDFSLQETHGLDTFNHVQAAVSHLPIVLLSSHEDELAALRALQHGAQDYLFKDQLTAESVAGAIRKAVERKRAEKGLTYLAQYDSLTAVANRTLFRDRLEQALARCKRKPQKVALMLIGLDHFKKVNESLGREGGDAVLKAVAYRLEQSLREVDTIARLWEDQFALLLEGLANESNIAMVAERIVFALSEPFVAEGEEVNLTASMGITVFPQDNHGADDLLKHAETAMHQAKEQGGNTHRLYTVEE